MAESTTVKVPRDGTIVLKDNGGSNSYTVAYENGNVSFGREKAERIVIRDRGVIVGPCLRSSPVMDWDVHFSNPDRMETCEEVFIATYTCRCRGTKDGGLVAWHRFPLIEVRVEPRQRCSSISLLCLLLQPGALFPTALPHVLVTQRQRAIWAAHRRPPAAALPAGLVVAPIWVHYLVASHRDWIVPLGTLVRLGINVVPAALLL